MYGHCHVEANSLEDAIKIALGLDTPLPDGFYVEDSAAVDYDVFELDQDKKNSDKARVDVGCTRNECDRVHMGIPLG